MKRCAIGIDIGGTFTDVVLVDGATSRYHRVKVPSTPADPAVGALNGVTAVLRQAGFPPEDVGQFRHGTTIATNAILEGKLAPCALITTAGFRDVLEIARQRRPSPYDFQAEKPPPIVPRRLRYEVRERVGNQGEVLQPLVEADVSAVLDRLRTASIRSIAVCLLFSFLNPAHERRIGEIVREVLPEMPVFLSSEILPEYREYERTSTVALSAAVAPVVSQYVQNLSEAMHSGGVECELHLMKSTGGLMPFSAVDRRAVETVLSGPAAGAIAAGYWGSLIGQSRLIGFDMGGTSTDVSLIVDGKPRVTTEGKIGHHPLKLPIIDVRTIGAGGGSIAWLDVVNSLHVGPQSAGADPGPACFGRQATSPTVTDANLCLGRLNPNYFLGGAIGLDVEASRRAIEDQIARPAGLDLRRAAQGIIEIVNSNMGRAIREISVANGYDVREFALMTFGGAGALHACSLAEELDIPLVVVPADAGLLSARGLLVADVKAEYGITRISRVADTKVADLERGFAALEAQAVRELQRDGVDTTHCFFEHLVDMRYVGQAYEITAPEPVGVTGEALVAAWGAEFHRLHEQLYWWNDSARPVEIVNLRVNAIVPAPKTEPVREEPSGPDPSTALKERRPVIFPGRAQPVETPIFDRERLRPGNAIAGPAIVESFDTTVLVNAGYCAEVDPLHNILIRAT